MGDASANGWELRFEYDSDDNATATICERYGSGRYYDIAEITNIPCELDEEGNPTPIRHGDYAQRLREVVIMVRAKDVLDAIKQLIGEMESLTGLNGGAPEQIWNGAPSGLYQRIVGFQDRLERLVDLSEDTEQI